MILRKDSWSHAEDESIISVILDHARRGEKQKDAFAFLAEWMPHRTQSAIEQRWYAYLRKKVLGNPLYDKETVDAAAKEKQDEVIMLSLERCIEILSVPHLDEENKEIVNRILRKHLLNITE